MKSLLLSFMSVDRINYLNIGLMLGSLALAFAAPFEVFLFSYALLAPLHYFTEIAWLHQRQYFSPGRYDFIWLGFLAACMFLTQFIVTDLDFLTASLVALAFFLPLTFLLVKKRVYRFISIFLILLGVVLLSDFRWYFVLFAVFMTTIIHTFVFTGLFILHGALKKATVTGLASLVVYILCVAACFLIVPTTGVPELSRFFQEAYSGFWVMNSELMRLLSYPFQGVDDLYDSAGALMVMRFVTFVYLYHYMNWFSKTSLIGWHRSSKASLVVVFLTWALCLSMFLYDYRLGIMVIYFFSMLHVFLEFPLNHQTMLGIGRILLGRM